MLNRRKKRRGTEHIGSTFIVLLCIIFSIVMSNHYKNQSKLLAAMEDDVQSLSQQVKEFDNERQILCDTIADLEKENQQLKDTVKTQEEKIVAKSKVTAKVTTVSTSTRYRDLRSFDDIDVDQMNAWIDELTKNNTKSPFRDQGAVFIKASNESGLDPRYILAHAAIESAWGSSYLARTKHNYFGIAAYDSSPNSAYSMGNGLESGIVNGAKWIAENYTNQGQHTLHLMIYGKKRYASAADSWINAITGIMNQCTL